MRKTLRELRLARGWRQEDLARETNIPRKRISKFETRELGPTPDELRRICEKLGCQPADLDVLPPRKSGGQVRPLGSLLAKFRETPSLIKRPAWTSAVRLAGLRQDLPGFFRTIERQLEGWKPFLDEVPSDCRSETIFQLSELRRKAGQTFVSTAQLGFSQWPVCDQEGRGAAHYLRPALVTEHWILIFQVEVSVNGRRIRMDGLLLVLDPKRTFICLEIDGRLRDAKADQERTDALGMLTLRIPADELFHGPGLTERLRKLGFCQKTDGPDAGAVAKEAEKARS